MSKTFSVKLQSSLVQEIMIGFVIFCFGIGCIFVSQYILNNYYPNPVTPHDIVLENVGPFPLFIIVGELASSSSILLYWYTAYRQGFATLPEFLSKLGLMYALRALTIVLTPLASIQPNGSGHATPVLSNLYFGMFFSGHTASAFIIYYTDRYSKRTKLLKLFTASVVAISLILSHSHYSIDIVGGILVAYLIKDITIVKPINKMLHNVTLKIRGEALSFD